MATTLIFAATLLVSRFTLQFMSLTVPLKKNENTELLIHTPFLR